MAVNILVYHYSGDRPAQNHLTSIATKRIARTGKSGKLPQNKNFGDHVIVISKRHDDNYLITHGLYRGIDPEAPDVWNDDSSTYDRSCVEIWEPLATKVMLRGEMFDFTGQGVYGDNTRNAKWWLEFMVR